MRLLVVLLILFAAFCPLPDHGAWFVRNLFGFGILSAVISFLLSKKYHVSVGLLFFVTSIYGLVQVGNPQFGSEVCSSLLILLLFACIGLGLDNNSFELIVPILGVIAIGDASAMIVRALLHIGEFQWNMQGYWVLTNGSLDASFIALMSPVVYRFSSNIKLKVFFVSILLLAILLAKSNTGFCVLIMILLTNCLMHKEFKLFFQLLFAFIISLFPIGYYLGPKLLNHNGRFNNWKLMMGYWNDHINHWIGSGPGTYWPLSQIVQIHKDGDNVWPWMHNDFLQVLFEQGIVGLALVLFLYFTMLYKAFDKPMLFSMILGFGAVACTLYPLHLFYFQILGISLIYQCFQQKDPSHGIA